MAIDGECDVLRLVMPETPPDHLTLRIDEIGEAKIHYVDFARKGEPLNFRLTDESITEIVAGEDLRHSNSGYNSLG